MAILLLLHPAPVDADQYRYDALGRLRSVISASGKQTIYSYDAAGNRTSVSTTNSIVNHPVDAFHLARELNEDSSRIDLRPEGNDIDGQPLTIVSVSPARYGVTGVVANQIRYERTAPPRFAGEDVFTYTLQDSAGFMSSAVIRIALKNLAPTAVTDQVTVARNGAVTLQPLSNDTDPGGDPLTLVRVGQGANGATFPDGVAVTYRPRTGFTGSDSFTYDIADGEGGTATGSVEVLVPNAAPIPSDDVISVPAGSFVTFDPRAGDRDPEGDPLRVVDISGASRGQVELLGPGSVRYTPSGSEIGSDFFYYRVNDDREGTAVGRVNVEIRSGNRPPSAADAPMTVLWNREGTIAPPVSDPDGDTLTLSIVLQGSRGTARVSGKNVYYQASGSASGSDSFTYSVSDGQGGTASATVNVTIEGTS